MLKLGLDLRGDLEDDNNRHYEVPDEKIKYFQYSVENDNTIEENTYSNHYISYNMNPNKNKGHDDYNSNFSNFINMNDKPYEKAYEAETNKVHKPKKELINDFELLLNTISGLNKNNNQKGNNSTKKNNFVIKSQINDT